MLSTEQLKQFDEVGYLLLSDLIPKETVVKAEEAMWHLMGMDAEEPASWEHFKRPHLTGFYIEKLANGKRLELFGVTHPDVLACCTPEYLTVLKQLAERYPAIPHCKSQFPDGIWAMNQFPVAAEWKSPSPHLDGDFRDFRLDPGTFRTTSITYLTDANSHQGNNGDMARGDRKRIRKFRKKNPEFSNHVSRHPCPVSRDGFRRTDGSGCEARRCTAFPSSITTFRHHKCRRVPALRNTLYVFVSQLPRMAEKRGVEYLDALVSKNMPASPILNMSLYNATTLYNPRRKKMNQNRYRTKLEYARMNLPFMIMLFVFGLSIVPSLFFCTNRSSTRDF